MSRIDYDDNINRLRQQLIVTSDDLKAASLLDFNIDEEKIIPYIIEAQDLYLEPLIGTSFVKALKDPDRTWIYDYLVTEYITPVLIHWALGIYIKKAPFQVAEGGVFKHFSSDSETATNTEVRLIVKEEHDKAETYGKRLVNYLDVYRVHYPEWTATQSEGVKQKQEITYLGGWVLDNRGCVNSYKFDSCSGIVYDPDLLTAVFYYGNNLQFDMGFDPSTLSTTLNTVPNYVDAQPIENYFWMVSDKDFIILQNSQEVPLSDFSDTDPLSETFVKGTLNNLYWIRIKIIDTYEEVVQYQIKTIKKMAKKYTGGIKIGIGYDPQINRPFDEREIVETKTDLTTLDNTYQYIEVKVADESGAKYRWNGLNQADLNNWQLVDGDGVGGGGDMLKSTYDTNNNGKVDDSDRLGGYLPNEYLRKDEDSDYLKKSVYDTNNNGKVDDSDKLGGENPSFYDQTSDVQGLRTDLDAHTSDNNLHLSTDERAAINNSPNAPTSLNPFATQNDLAAGGNGDMLKATYDQNDNGIVDNAENLGGQPPSNYDQSAHVADTTTNPHNVTKANVGLGNVDNTTDADKPISAATQAEIDRIDGVNSTQDSNISLNASNISTNTSDITSLQNNTVSNDVTGEPTGADPVIKAVSLTQAEYDAGTPIATTLYVITDA